MRRLFSALAALFMILLMAEAGAQTGVEKRHQWSEEEMKTLRSLSLSTLPPLPADPSNRYADDPKAVELGRRLFFDMRFSANGKVSCATCHIPNIPSATICPLPKA